MQIKLDFDHCICVVTKDEGVDPTFRNSGWATAESTFLHHVKRELTYMGFNVIKKRMWKDGHLVNDEQQYVRTKKWKDESNPEQFAVYNRDYQIQDAGLEFNRTGKYILGLFW